LGWGLESVVVEIEVVAHVYRQMEGANPNLAHQWTQWEQNGCGRVRTKIAA
jgi:hypothetical protein